MKKVLLTSICILCVYANILFSGEIYKWVDDKGVAHYSDSPTDNSNFEKIDVEIIPAIKYVEPVPQISDDPISQISGVPVSQTNKKLVPQIEEKTDDKALQQKKQITIKKKVIVYERIKNVLPYIKNGEIQSKPINSTPTYNVAKW